MGYIQMLRSVTCTFSQDSPWQSTHDDIQFIPSFLQEQMLVKHGAFEVDLQLQLHRITVRSFSGPTVSIMFLYVRSINLEDFIK